MTRHKDDSRRAVPFATLGLPPAMTELVVRSAHVCPSCKRKDGIRTLEQLPLVEVPVEMAPDGLTMLSVGSPIIADEPGIGDVMDLASPTGRFVCAHCRAGWRMAAVQTTPREREIGRMTIENAADRAAEVAEKLSGMFVKTRSSQPVSISAARLLLADLVELTATLDRALDVREASDWYAAQPQPFPPADDEPLPF